VTPASLPVAPSWPHCPLCAQRAKLLQGPHGTFYVCAACDTRIGCKPGTTTPWGPLVPKRTRDLRVEAHRVFDTLWRAKAKRGQTTQARARDCAYTWLAQQMGVEQSACHLAQFSDTQLEQVIELCASRAERLQVWLDQSVSRAP